LKSKRLNSAYQAQKSHFQQTLWTFVSNMCKSTFNKTVREYIQPLLGAHRMSGRWVQFVMVSFRVAVLLGESPTTTKATYWNSATTTNFLKKFNSNQKSTQRTSLMTMKVPINITAT